MWQSAKCRGLLSLLPQEDTFVPSAVSWPTCPQMTKDQVLATLCPHEVCGFKLITKFSESLPREVEWL